MYALTLASSFRVVLCFAHQVDLCHLRHLIMANVSRHLAFKVYYLTARASIITPAQLCTIRQQVDMNMTSFLAANAGPSVGGGEAQD